MIHFLHLGKTGGVAIKHALEPVAEQYGIVLHSHEFSLREVSGNDKVVFSIRSPVSRFISGFNSRFRRGQPKFNSAWQFGEREAFERFPNPNILAESLWAAEQETRNAARMAMLVIEHVRSSFTDWLWSLPSLEYRRNDVAFILATESLSTDFELMKLKLNLPRTLELPEDPTLSHRTPDGFMTEISDVARRNLECWYAKDIAFHQYLERLRQSILASVVRDFGSRT